MLVNQLLSDLNERINIAYDEVNRATHAYNQATDEREKIECFISETEPSGDIATINKGDCLVMSLHYKLSGRMVLFTITFVKEGDGDVIYVGQIIDCLMKTVLYTCQFYKDYFDENEELFDHLLAKYMRWMLGL